MKLWLKGNITIPPRPRSVGGLIGWARGVNRALVELRERKIVGNVTTRAASGIKPPLWVTLRTLPGDPITYEVFAEYGHVVPRHNSSTDTGEPIEITSLPTKDAPLAVIEDDKLWVELTIGVDGKCTAADFDSGATWPEDVPPDLVGGDGTGTAGQRYIRIAEIIANPESTATPPPLIRKQLHTGHIDYAQPTLAENTISSASGNQGRTLKAWNATEGQWEFRYLEAGDGVEITEEADRIVVAATGASHPWKATENGDEFITIAAGELLAARTSSGGGYPFYWEELSYAGGNIEVTAATGYILISMVVTEEQAGDTNAGDSGILASPASFTVEFQPTLPDVTDDMAFPICKVALAAGVATVTKQILTHNPSPSVTWISPAP